MSQHGGGETSSGELAGWSGFVAGAQAPFRGWSYLRRRPALWRYAVLPFLANVVITLATLALLIGLLAWLLPVVHGWFTASEPAWWAWTLRVVEALLVLAAVAGSVAVAVIVWMLASGIVCGYFWARLAEEVEVALGVPRAELQSLSLAYEASDAVRRTAILLAIQVGFLLLAFTPVVGPPLAAAGSLYFTWLVCGMDFLDFPLALRGWRYEQKRQFSRRHRAATLGLGAAVAGLQFVPIAGALLLTTAVVGAVRLHRELRAAEGSARAPSA